MPDLQRALHWSGLQGLLTSDGRFFRPVLSNIPRSHLRILCLRDQCFTNHLQTVPIRYVEIRLLSSGLTAFS